MPLIFEPTAVFRKIFDERAAQLIEAAIQAGFEASRLRPMELGGDQGTAALTKEVIALVKDVRA